MRITEYIEKQRATLPKELAETLIEQKSIWSNEAAYGYCIMAMEDAGYPREKISELIGYLHDSFDFVSPEEAEEKFHNW